MKEYVVNLFSEGEQVEFDALPVAKITHYPLEKKDYKPYAQGILCLSDKQFSLRLLAFEVNPLEDSEIGGVFYIYPDHKEICLEIWANPKGATAWINTERDRKMVELNCHKISGEDLQGVYWGYDIFLELSELAAFGRMLTRIDKSFSGNFFKVQKVKPTHFGAFDQAEFRGGAYKDQRMAILTFY